MSGSSVWSGISCGLLFGLTGEPGLGGLIVEDFGDVAGLPLTGAELGDGVLFALAAVEDLEDVAAALGGDAPGIEVLGDGVVAVTGLAEADHVEDPLLLGGGDRKSVMEG